MSRSSEPNNPHFVHMPLQMKSSTISLDSKPPPNETPQQKVARLRAAAQKARAAQVSTFDTVLDKGRRVADKAHRIFNYSLLAASGKSRRCQPAGGPEAWEVAWERMQWANSLVQLLVSASAPTPLSISPYTSAEETRNGKPGGGKKARRQWRMPTTPSSMAQQLKRKEKWSRSN